MAAHAMSCLPHIFFLFLLMNYNYAERTSDTLKNNDDAFQGNGDKANLLEQNIELKGVNHSRKIRDLKPIRSLKLRLEWFDKSIDALVGGEYSRDLRDDGTVMERLGLSFANTVNNGGYNVLPSWVGILQDYFNHKINLGAFDYQVAFDYREWWEDMRVITFDLNKARSWHRNGGNIHAYLTPEVGGDIVRATYQYYGHNEPSTIVRIYLLGTYVDVGLYDQVEREFTLDAIELVKDQPFEVAHSAHAIKTRHSKIEMSRPLSVKFAFTMRVKT